jgi:choline dehydrogenase
VGVQWLHDQPQRATARREVLLCGAIASPQILQRSGVGPADLLRSLDIDLVHHLPGVGANLQDHLEMYLQYECKKPVSLAPAEAVQPAGDRCRVAVPGHRHRRQQPVRGRWLHPQRRRIRLAEPAVPLPAGGDQLQRLQPDQGARLPDARRFDALTQPRPHPCVRRTRANIRASCSTTCRTTRTGASSARRSASPRDLRAAGAGPYSGREISPGSALQTDAQIDAFVREHAETAYHPSCSNKMGHADDPMAVVDGQGRVHGLEGLRIVDASIMPQVVTGNLNAPTIMMAEKLADVIRGRTPLARSTAPYYKANGAPVRKQG